MTGPAAGRSAHVPRWLALTLLAVLALPGCASPLPHGDELYASARQANLAFKGAVATVLVHISDGTWQIQEYGDLPVECGTGFAFSLHRTTFEGWRLDVDATTTADRLGAWLGARGWKTGAPRTGDAGQVVVEASDPAADVARLTVEIRDGKADAIGVGATSTCFDGDARELAALLYPPNIPAAHEPLPAGELAGATPIFGFTEDGRPR